jgi:cytochrome c oxidase assembly protein subunit 16
MFLRPLSHLYRTTKPDTLYQRPPIRTTSLWAVYRAANMPSFQAKPFRRDPTASSTLGERVGASYRSRLPKRPFLLFGLPFILVIVAGSFVLTPAAALRYERHDRKVQQLSQEEALQLGIKGPDGEQGIKRNPRRRIVGNERDEYYVGTGLL